MGRIRFNGDVSSYRVRNLKRSSVDVDAGKLTAGGTGVRCDGMVEIRDEFYRRGKEERQRRFVNGALIFDIGSPVVFIDLWNLQSVWTSFVKLPTSLVKEGPKALVLCRR